MTDDHAANGPVMPTPDQYRQAAADLETFFGPIVRARLTIGAVSALSNAVELLKRAAEPERDQPPRCKRCGQRVTEDEIAIYGVDQHNRGWCKRCEQALWTTPEESQP